MCVCVCYAWARIIFFEEFGCWERERRERPNYKKKEQKKSVKHTQNVTRVIKNSPHNRNRTHTQEEEEEEEKKFGGDSQSLSLCLFLLLSLLFLRALSFCDSSLVRARAWVSFAIGINTFSRGTFFSFPFLYPFLSLSLDRYIKGGFVLSFERERETRESSRGLPLFCFSLSRVCEENS